MRLIRVLFAAFLGYALIGVLIYGTDQAFSKLIPGFSSMKTPPAGYFLISMATDTVYSLIGGWLCAILARGDGEATLGLIVIGELAGIVSAALLWSTVPHYYSLYLLITYPPAVWFGAKFRERMA